LMTNWNFLGRSAGNSAGFAPFRILSTKLAARLNSAEVSVPYDIRAPSSRASLACPYIVGKAASPASFAVRALFRIKSPDRWIRTPSTPSATIRRKAPGISAGLRTPMLMSWRPSALAALSACCTVRV